MTPWNKGLKTGPLSENTKKKLSVVMKGIKKSTETRKKMSISAKGKILSEETRKKIGVASKGRKHSEETRKKMCGRYGEKSSTWKGGISKIDKLCRNMSEYKQWRSDVFKRDNWVCKTCNLSGIYVTAHHKKSFSKIIKENKINNINDARNCDELWDTGNGVTLCEDCHKLTDNYKGRGQNIISNK